jgi:hypothetical protein
MFGQSTVSPDLDNIDETNFRLVGPNMLADILVDDVPCRCLVDSGSQVTTISQGFYWEHLSHAPLQSVDSCLKVTGAGDQPVPYLGYIEVEVTLPADNGDLHCYSILALVVPDTPFHMQAPVLLGTNLLQLCYSTCIGLYGPSFSHWPVPPSWKQAYQSFAMVENMVQQGVFSQKPTPTCSQQGTYYR